MRYRKLLFIPLVAFAFTCFASENSQHDSTISNAAFEYVVSPSETYKIIEKLGEGALAEVFAVENSHGESFALKAYKHCEETLQGVFWEHLKDIEREYQLGLIVNHPNIVKPIEYFFDVTEESEYVGYLVMELVEGETVYNSERKMCSQQKSIVLAGQLLDVLHYAHSLGFMYLDLHSNNIMIEKGEDIKIVDLASFFSYEELKEFFDNDTTTTADDETAAQQTSDSSEKDNTPPKLTTVRKNKLQKFFEKHKKLVKVVKKEIDRIKKIPKRISKSNDAYCYDDTAVVKKHMDPIYINRIAKLCRTLVSKSDSMKDEKINVFINIMSIVWDFEESLEEDEDVVFEECLQSLQNTLYQSRKHYDTR
ncbi:MAG: protein kinase [Waddliaceae bacterium]|jgi:tRNA A-37 threonylcarbamoyl transferase component Bud32|nr:protein kinase [Waddliaceae bacterium]MBT3578841.1 protein kinase [Waddliaceae bacterium]MBT4444633.1 protein kinase [Waddliaceae bacterium]MBT6928807.1 protein kinase [Waddliaceae bacterium]MBT7263852.1 protein kinase [Waddliaceae bacterium]